MGKRNDIPEFVLKERERQVDLVRLVTMLITQSNDWIAIASYYLTQNTREQLCFTFIIR